MSRHNGLLRDIGAINRRGVLIVLVVGLAAWNAGCGADGYRAPTGISSREADALRSFAVFVGYDDATEMLESPEWENAHWRALRDLLTARGNEAWLVLLLLGGDYSVLPTTSPTPMVAIPAMLDRIPDDVGPAVLWALTCYLNDRTRYPVCKYDEVKPGLVEYAYGLSDPVRDMVRRKLVRALKVDKEYSVAEWRAAILSHAQSK